MLNRRSLRIKVMQFLYALERQKEAFWQIAREEAGAHFDADLNQDEIPDVEQLNQSKKETLQYFDLSRELGLAKIPKVSEEILSAIKEGLKKYKELLKDAEKETIRKLNDETLQITNSYFKLLTLPLAWAETAGQDSPSAHQHPGPLDGNLILEAIGNNQRVKEILSKHKLTWDTEVVGEWYRKIIKKSDCYQEYLANTEFTLSEYRSFLADLYKGVIFKNEVIDAYMEENDIGWSENRGILKSMIIKTIKTYDEATKSIELINLSPNWDEDNEFYKKLYAETVKDNDALEEIIASKSKNWDAERIASVDKIIMKMAITEFTKFPSIPVKVTINEYIEICKGYSTPKSKQYVNGILDVLSVEMRENGTIKKSGRGLLDNK